MNKTIKLTVDSLDTSIVEMCRSSVRAEAVERYKTALENAGKKWVFPSVVVWQDGETNYLLDGHHRLLAVKQIPELAQIPVTIKAFATRDEAYRYALHVNSTNGEKLTRDEVRANIRAYLQNGGAIESDTAIAILFGVNRMLVGDIRANRDGMTKKEKATADVSAVLEANPNATITEITEKANISRVTARKIKRQLEAGEPKKVEGVVLDCYGREVPQNNLEKLFKIKASLKQCSATLADLSNAVQGMVKAGAFARTSEVEMVDNAIAQIRNILKQRKPDALCTCRGDGCRKCGGVGFMEKTMFNVIVPQSDK